MLLKLVGDVLPRLGVAGRFLLRRDVRPSLRVERIEGQPLPTIGEFSHPDFHTASPDYFRVMGIPLLRGRSFVESDNARASGVVLISESLARRYWPDGDAVGKRVMVGHPSPKNT